MCEINNNDVGRYLVFTGMIQRLHCDWIQWTERRNNKRYKVALIRIQYFSIKTTGESSRNKLNQNLVFPITSFSCCVRGDYCCPICSAHVKGKCYNLTILDVSIRDDKWHRRNLGPTFKNLTVQPFRYNWWWMAMKSLDILNTLFPCVSQSWCWPSTLLRADEDGDRVWSDDATPATLSYVFITTQWAPSPHTWQG